MQLSVVGLPEELCIGAYGIQTDENIAREAGTCTVVESDDIRIVIMLQILAVDG